MMDRPTDCTDCPLADQATNLVWGVGPVPAEYMIVGEAPGYWEDRRGQPFVANAPNITAGFKLDELIRAAGLDRADMYLTNTVKCRPPGNRDPQAKELKACRKWLEMELAAVQPEVIITVGKKAADWFDKTIKLKKDHGQPRDLWVPMEDQIDGRVQRALLVRLVPMYHPAAALHNASYWPIMLLDWQLMATRLAPSEPPATDYRLATNEEALGYVRTN